jgi:hypothetical protein
MKAANEEQIKAVADKKALATLHKSMGGDTSSMFGVATKPMFDINKQYTISKNDAKPNIINSTMTRLDTTLNTTSVAVGNIDDKLSTMRAFDITISNDLRDLFLQI